MNIVKLVFLLILLVHDSSLFSGILAKTAIWVEKNESPSNSNLKVVNLTDALPTGFSPAMSLSKKNVHKMMPVENLKIGDSVISFNPITNKIESVKIIDISKKVISKIRKIVVMDLAWIVTLLLHKLVKMSKVNPEAGMILQFFLKQHSSKLTPFLIGDEINGFGHAQEIALSPNAEVFCLSETMDIQDLALSNKLMQDVFSGAFLCAIQRGPPASRVFLALAVYDIDLLKDPNAELIEEYFLKLERNQTVFVGDVGICVNSLDVSLINN